MSKIIKLWVAILMLTGLPGFNMHAGNENWKSFMFDKQLWDFGPPDKILTYNDEIYVGGGVGMKEYE